jgi:hypothetical protein
MTSTDRSRPWRERMLVTWDIRGAEPTAEDETVALEADGTAWLWVRVPASSERGDVVGSFRIRVGDGQLVEARALVDRIGAPAEAATGPGHRGTVTVTGGGHARTFPLRSGDGLAADAIRLARDLASAAFAEPLAALRFTARLRPALDLSALEGVDPALLPDVLKPSRGGPSALLGFVVEGLGSKPTRLVLDAERLQAHWLSGDRAVAWTELARPDVGLNLGGPGDGLRAPVLAPPGSSAAVTVRADLPDEPTDGVVVRVTGRIELLGPWPSKGLPDAAFEVRTAPASMGAADD